MSDKEKDATLRFDIPRDVHTTLTEEAKRMRVRRDGYYRKIMESAARRVRKRGHR